ncbi:MAG: hypothetical protein DMG14_24740 [Acidobacteria bacterium]|nr:MAG: hypothetical protein DMG14_24740 [Acidobacteriota bacterium]
MDLLRLTAQNAEGKHVDCAFEIRVVDTQTATLGPVIKAGPVFELSFPQPTRFQIVARPPKRFFPAQGVFRYEGGFVQPIGRSEIQFFPWQGLPRSAGNVTFLVACLSRLQEVTVKSGDLLNDRTHGPRHGNNEDRHPKFPLDPRPFATFPSVSVNQIKPIDPSFLSGNGRLDLEKKTIAPQFDLQIFEVAGTLPKLFAVIWPKSLKPAEAVEGAPFLVLFRNRVQAGPVFYFGYPFGWDFLMYGFWQWLFYQNDPLPGEGAALLPLTGVGRARGSMIDTRMGFPYQMEVANRKVILVVPLHAPGANTGDFADAESMEKILKEIVWVRCRESRIYRTPIVGRTALCAFSSGHLSLADFIRKSEALMPAALDTVRAFYENKIMELYFFDPPQSKGSGNALQTIVGQALRWETHNKEKMIRLYNTVTIPTAHDKLLKESIQSLPPAPYFRSRNDGRISAAVIPAKTWIETRKTVTTPQAAGVIDHGDGPHPFFTALCLRDALERSGFTKA